jgi:hypothetical protein
LVDKSEAALTVFGENEIRVDVNHLPQERALFVDRFCYLRALCDVAKNPRDKLSLLSRQCRESSTGNSVPLFLAHHVYHFSDNVRFALGDETCHFLEGWSRTLSGSTVLAVGRLHLTDFISKGTLSRSVVIDDVATAVYRYDRILSIFR